MEESPKEKLSRLKSEYLVSKQSYELKTLIEDKRSLLDESLQKLKDEIEDDLFTHHREKKSDEDKSDTLQSNQELLQSVAETRKKLDSKLDELDMLSSEILVRLKKSLIEAICDVYPEKKQAYDELNTQIEENQKSLRALQETESLLDQIGNNLEIIKSEREAIKKRSIFKYLFGKNPNYVITKSLKELEKQTEKLCRSLENQYTQFHGDLKTLLKNCIDACRILQTYSQGRWGWKKLDKEIIPYSDPINGLREEIKETKQNIETETNELKSSLDEWIEKNAG